MTRKNSPIVFVLILSLFTSACFAIKWQPTQYTPKRLRAGNPIRKARALIEANVRPGCVVDTEQMDAMINVKFVCQRIIGNNTIRLDKVSSVELLQHKEWFMVQVKHREGIEDFEWTSKVRSDMERLADALSTASKRRSHSAKAGSNRI